MSRNKPRSFGSDEQKKSKAASPPLRSSGASATTRQNADILLPTRPPEHLTGEACEYWITVTTHQRRLVENGHAPFITEAERQLLEIACECYRQWRLSLASFNVYYDMLEKNSPGSGHRVMFQIKERADGDKRIQISPLARAIGQAEDRFRATLRTLGMSNVTNGKIERRLPADRSGSASKKQRGE